MDRATGFYHSSESIFSKRALSDNREDTGRSRVQIPPGPSNTQLEDDLIASEKIMDFRTGSNPPGSDRHLVFQPMIPTNTPSEAELIIQKLPSDMGIHRNPRKGTLNAPEVLLEKFDSEKTILVDEVFPEEFSLEKTQARIFSNSDELKTYGKPVLSVGGDHSVSFPVIKSLKQEYPEMKLVWLDAHLDLKKKVGDNISHDVIVRELLKEDFRQEEIYIVGVTRIDQDEQVFIEENDLNIYRSDEIEKFLREFEFNEQPVYLSVDIDVLKASIAPGTGYPDGELCQREVEKVIETINPEFADLVEVAPPFDRDEKTVENGRSILEKLVEKLSE